MEELLDPRSKEARRAPDFIRARAKKDGKKVLHIVWDKAGGYPPHAWGYEQWSVRPYEQGYGCDGTTDCNIHFIGRHLCGLLGLDYKELYTEAYREHDGDGFDSDWLDDLERYEAEIILPGLSQRSLKLLLYDLCEINNHSMERLLNEKFTNLGYDVDKWWLMERS
jgi:hypothetical protein